MKILIYEPDRIKSGSGINTSERVEHFMKVLAEYSPTELRNIQELRDNKTLQQLDVASNIFLAHFTDVQSGFYELKKFSNALVVFHTYDTSWYPNEINSNPICISINNGKNRYCIGSAELKATVKSFIDDYLKNGKPNSEKLYGKNIKLETLLEPFGNCLPLEEYWNKDLKKKKQELHKYLNISKD